MVPEGLSGAPENLSGDERQAVSSRLSQGLGRLATGGGHELPGIALVGGGAGRRGIGAERMREVAVCRGRLASRTANAILRRFGGEPQEELASARSPQELTSLVRRSAKHGTLELDTTVLLERSIAFGDRHAVDVMTPRARMQAVDADSDVLAMLALARRTGRSRFPVIDGDSDPVVGIVHVKDAMSVPPERRDRVPVRAVMAEPVFVPSSVGLDSLLSELQRGGLQMAVVVDEFGTVDGIVTLEDLIEEIVGEVRDEHDKRDTSVRRHADGTWPLSGLLRPDEVAHAVGIALPEDEEYETLAGLVAFRLGRMAQEGDSVTLDTIDTDRRPQRVTLIASAMDGLRVDRVRLETKPLADEGDDDSVSTGSAIALAAVLLGANAFFVGAEFALVSARRTTIEPRAQAGSRAAKITLRAIEKQH